MRTKNLIHPGEILQEEFLVPMGISQTRIALDLHVPAPRINAIVRGKRAITADTALRLGRYLRWSRSFGSIFRLITTSALLRAAHGRGSKS